MMSLVKGIDQNGFKALIFNYYLEFIWTLDAHIAGQPDFVPIPVLQEPFNNNMQEAGQPQGAPILDQNRYLENNIIW